MYQAPDQRYVLVNILWRRPTITYCTLRRIPSFFDPAISVKNAPRIFPEFKVCTSNSLIKQNQNLSLSAPILSSCNIGNCLIHTALCGSILNKYNASTRCILLNLEVTFLQWHEYIRIQSVCSRPLIYLRCVLDLWCVCFHCVFMTYQLYQVVKTQVQQLGQGELTKPVLHRSCKTIHGENLGATYAT